MSSYAKQHLIVGTVKYATPELAAQARRQVAASEQAAQERRDKLAQTFEKGLKERFLATGATEDDWKAQRSSILAKAREAATLERADVSRTLNRSRYRG